MASIIRVKRSTGTTAPSSLNFGEVGVTLSGSGTQANSGDRLFVGDNAGNPQVVGGRYFTDLLSNTAGSVASAANASTASNGFVPILTSDRKVDQWNVDNLRLDANVLSSTNTDGDIFFVPNGSGEVVVGDNIFLTFGDSKDSKITYDESGDDRINVTGADWVYENGVAIVMADVTDSHNKDTGALIVEGGVGIEKSVNIGGNLGVTGVSTFTGIGTFISDLFVGGDLHIKDDLFVDEMTIRNLKVTGVSTLIVLTPASAVIITVLVLVVTPKLMIGSFRLTVNESTVVVVPSTCKSPLTINVPALLKPSGYGSIYN